MDKDLVEDEVAEIKAAHFEESMKYARKTVRLPDVTRPFYNNYCPIGGANEDYFIV
ncbi:cell division cycle protein 48-like, partial [Trifolium medium]|nr:cell division cycle protein 48-like [Trifolium medium]